MTGFSSPTLAVDVDNCLVTWADDGSAQVNELVRDFLRAWKYLGGRVIVWSGGGSDYASRIVRTICIEHLVDQCCSKILPKGEFVSLTIDDQDCKLGLVNLKLPGDITATPWMANNLPG